MAQSTLRDSGFDVALSILLRRKWIGVIAFALTLSLALPFVYFLPNIYRGVATVIVDKNQRAVTSVSDRSVILVRGTVVFDGASDRLRNEPEVIHRHLGV